MLYDFESAEQGKESGLLAAMLLKNNNDHFNNIGNLY